MLKEYKNLIIVSVSLLVVIGLIVLFAFVDIDLGIIKISSVETILAQYDKITEAEQDLQTQQKIYNSALESLETEKKKYENEKAKYESISDETVKIIKEATTQENYSIEYMWITLGNYAKVNNLSIVLVEPGGTTGSTEEVQNNVSSADKTESTPVEGEESTSTTSTTSDSSETNDVQSANKDESTEESDSNTSSNNSILKIQVEGSYMNVSDFVFDVENDKDLRFKLDNISMEYVSGTTIRATFDVKNTIIVK